MPTSASDRIAAASGALFVVLTVVGNQINVTGTDQSDHPSGSSVLRDAAHQAGSTTATIGFVLEFLGLLAFLGFLGYLLESRRRSPGGRTIAAGIAVLAGVLMLAVKLASVAPVGALSLDRTGLSPETAQVLNDMNGMAFIVCWLPYAVFVGAAAVGLYRCGMVGRPTLVIGLVAGVGGLAVGLIALHDPLNGNPMGWLLGLLWTLAVSVRLAVRPGSAREAAPAAGAAQVREPVEA